MEKSKKVKNTNAGVAAANPGDIIIRSDGSEVELTQGDIDWAKQQLQQEAAAEVSTPSVEQPKTSSNSTTRTSPPSSQTPVTQNPSYVTTTNDENVAPSETQKLKDEQTEKNDVVEEEKKHPARKVYGQVDPKDVKGKFVYLSVSKSKGTMDVFVSRDESGKNVEKTATFNVVTNVQKDSKDKTKASDTSRRQSNNGTNPTQVLNGIYEVTQARAPITKDGNTDYGVGNQGLYVNVTQELLNSKSQYVEDNGYMTHITPLDYTNGCVGFKYIKKDDFSRQTALNQQMYLISLYDECINSGSTMFIEYRD